jgi:thymidylate kinase
MTSCANSGHIKGRERRGLQHQEVKMKLITRFELAAKNENELHAYLREAFNELARSEPDSHQRRNALASIENIQNEISARATLEM